MQENKDLHLLTYDGILYWYVVSHTYNIYVFYSEEENKEMNKQNWTEKEDSDIYIYIYFYIYDNKLNIL